MAGLPFGRAGTDQTQVGEIQGWQVRRFLPSGARVLCTTGPLRSAAGNDELVADKQLAARVLTPNTGLALHRFWAQGTNVPLRAFTEARPWPPGSAGA
jgi:hypothetical protein